VSHLRWRARANTGRGRAADLAPEGALSNTGRESVAREVKARVEALDVDYECAVLRHADLKCSEVWAPPEIGSQAEIGDAATLYLDVHGGWLGWRLSDKKLGVREDYR
jgi:hypothetical protein